MFGKLIKLYPINEELNIYKWGVKLVSKDNLSQSNTIYTLFDRCIPISLYEKVWLKSDVSSDIEEDLNQELRYQITQIDNEKGTLTLKEYGNCSIDDVISSKPDLIEGFYIVKLVFIYKDLKFNTTIRTYSSPTFVKINKFYEDFKEVDDEGNKVTYDVDFEDLEVSHRYVQLVSKLDKEKSKTLEVAEDLNNKLATLNSSIKQ